NIRYLLHAGVRASFRIARLARLQEYVPEKLNAQCSAAARRRKGSYPIFLGGLTATPAACSSASLRSLSSVFLQTACLVGSVAGAGPLKRSTVSADAGSLPRPGSETNRLHRASTGAGDPACLQGGGHARP